MPLRAFSLFLAPCTGRLPPYFLPRTFLPDMDLVTPPILYLRLVDLFLSPCDLQDDNWLAPNSRSGLELLHSSAGASASTTSLINILLFIWEHLPGGSDTLITNKG